MSSRSERERRRVIERGSPLAGHSLNQRKVGIHRAGLTRLFGRDVNHNEANERRLDAKNERKSVLQRSIENIFSGNPSEEDVLGFVLLADEFEVGDHENPSVTIIDFRCLDKTPRGSR